MPSVILDSCGILNLYASGRFVPILKALQHEWYLAAAVERESQQCRQPDPADPEKLIVAPIDLLPAIESGILIRCNCESDDETNLYVELAAQIGDDGESMGLAIAKCRGWSVLTDDKKACRIAKQLDISVLSTTEVLKAWADIEQPSAADLSAVLQSIERFANYKPGRSATHFRWWVTAIATAGS